jgi:hypothetical protein
MNLPRLRLLVDLEAAAQTTCAADASHQFISSYIFIASIYGEIDPLA